MQTIYTLITCSYNGTITMNVSISLETQQKFADALGITLEQYRGIKGVTPNAINEEK